MKQEIKKLLNTAYWGIIWFVVLFLCFVPLSIPFFFIVAGILTAIAYLMKIFGFQKGWSLYVRLGEKVWEDVSVSWNQMPKPLRYTLGTLGVICLLVIVRWSWYRYGANLMTLVPKLTHSTRAVLTAPAA